MVGRILSATIPSYSFDMSTEQPPLPYRPKADAVADDAREARRSVRTWLVLCVVWAVGLAVWAAYLALILFVVVKVFGG